MRKMSQKNSSFISGGKVSGLCRMLFPHFRAYTCFCMADIGISPKICALKYKK